MGICEKVSDTVCEKVYENLRCKVCCHLAFESLQLVWPLQLSRPVWVFHTILFVSAYLEAISFLCLKAIIVSKKVLIFLQIQTIKRSKPLWRLIAVSFEWSTYSPKHINFPEGGGVQNIRWKAFLTDCYKMHMVREILLEHNDPHS